ncbi:MAG TPA: hypothetical protein VJS63_02510 [Bradyrhizobium sp.]|nr:hypothetical protein [Bradyrhizobium sp.]
MTHAFRFCRALIVGFSMMMACGGVARCEDPAESSRDSIIQGVRDDVRRQIREREAREVRSEARTGETSSTTPYRPRKSKVKKHN